MDPTDPLCIVPARGTSPGLPKKHFKELAGKPVLAHTVETALACPGIDEVVVTTEDAALADLAREYGARAPFLRPERLAGDALLHEVVSHAVDELRAERPVTEATPVVVLQPNVPFRRVADVETAVERFRAGHESVISVAEERRFFWRARKDGANGANGEDGGDQGRAGDRAASGRLEPRFAERALRADLEPFYRETGSINVTSTTLLDRGTRVGSAPGYVVTDRLSSLAIDGVVDLWLAERLAQGPRVVFRVDGGGDRGLGHVSRCLTLAAELERTLRAAPTFVCRTDYPAGIAAVRDAGREVQPVDPGARDPLAPVVAMDPDLVFLDVLDTDPERVQRLHRTAAAVVNLEDLAGGPEHADLVVNALYEPELVEAEDNHLAGAAYFVLREEFRDRPLAVPDHAAHGLLTFGGSDPAGLSALAVRAVAGDGRDYRLVRGRDFDDPALDAALADAPNVAAVTDPEMGALMEWADLAVCSGGRTAYELAATGTPTLVLAQNDREHERMTALGERGVVDYLGDGREASVEAVRAAVADLAADPERRRDLAERAREFVDGAGTRRILDAVHEALLG
jgi:spore coat polysaccharide biosynthesis predicted glycosyltransferase SpsG/CMP-N-acetylneuraminic acid synthetase